MSDEFDPTKIKLTERQVEALTYIEQVYMLEQVVPTAKKLSEVLQVSESTAKKWLASKEFDYILTTKGIVSKQMPGVLSAPQMMIVNMLLNLSDRRSEREKCEAAGITPAQLAVWRRDKQFMSYMSARAEAMFKDSDDIAYLNVIRNMQGGDLNAAKFYFEMTGKYAPSLRLDVNVDSILARVIEVLQVRVKDPGTLELIAKDLEIIMAGGSPVYDSQAIPAIARDAQGEFGVELPTVEVSDWSTPQINLGG